MSEAQRSNNRLPSKHAQRGAKLAVMLLCGLIAAALLGGCPRNRITDLNFEPASGSIEGGTVVTITGSNFGAATTATFGGVAATGVELLSDTQIRVTTPPNPAGRVTVVVDRGDGTAITEQNAFEYVDPGAPPELAFTRVEPDTGSAAGGETIELIGANFEVAMTVIIGGQRATGVTFVNPSKLRVVTPAHDAGLVSITIVSPDNVRAVSLSNSFEYVEP
ncbi:MAG: IPT/TIG domain-containing protein [Phycisphaerales bacterium]|nr:IPT/TIG domain-containing protein [Phycisphaerales bacterium]